MVSYDETEIRGEVGVIGALARGLHEFLNGLSDAELATQSACDAWTVRDVAGHLTNRAERQIASMTRGRNGDAEPPAGFSAPTDNRAMSAPTPTPTSNMPSRWEIPWCPPFPIVTGSCTDCSTVSVATSGVVLAGTPAAAP